MNGKEGKYHSIFEGHWFNYRQEKFQLTCIFRSTFQSLRCNCATRTPGFWYFYRPWAPPLMAQLIAPNKWFERSCGSLWLVDVVTAAAMCCINNCDFLFSVHWRSIFVWGSGRHVMCYSANTSEADTVGHVQSVHTHQVMKPMSWSRCVMWHWSGFLGCETF